MRGGISDKNYSKKLKAPETTRYCPICEQNTQFEYDRHILHSVCKNCGSRFAKKAN